MVKQFVTLLLVLFTVFVSHEVAAQASVVSGSVTTSKTAYTVGSGKNRLIVVAVTGEVGTGPIGTITGITWGGQALTQVRTQGSPGGTPVLRTDIWYLNEAGISAARGACSFNFVVTWSSAPTNEVFAAFTLKDIDQTTPVAASNSAGGNNITTIQPGNVAVGINDIMVYASSSTQDRTHTPPGTYTEQSDQIIGGAGGTSMATATRAITVAGNENPTATWATGNSRLINVGAGFNGITTTSAITYYSRNATSGGQWDDPNSWTLVSDGTGGPLPAGVWPTRTDNVVIRSGHTITVNATDDNKSCGLSPDGLGQPNIGPFISSNVGMFYQIGDITISGTLTISGVEVMFGGYTHLLAGGTLAPVSFMINTGYLEVDAATTFTGFNSLVLTGNSVTIINNSASFADDLYIDHTNATLCGTGTATLQNGGASQLHFTNLATIAQICTTFTISCSGSNAGGCGASPTVFPTTGTAVVLLGNAGPGGVGNSSNIKMWYMGDRDAFSDAGTTPVANGGTVRQWNDQSGNNNHATQATAGNRPIYRTAQTNGLGALEFTGDLFIDGPTPGIAATSSHTYIMTYRDTQTGTGGVNDGSGHYILDRTTATNGLVSLKPISGNVYFYQKRDDGGGGLGGPSSTSLINTNTKWIEMVRNRGTNYRLYYNGVQESSVADGDGNTTPPNPRIGRHATTTNGGLRGFVNEFIVYSTTITEIQRILINNYIAAKYALTLSANDVYTMDNSGNGDFDFQVAGIGQASDGSKHIDSKGPGIVRMWNPNNLTNGEYLLWGHNNGNLSGTTSGVDGTIIMQRLNRIWRVSETGDVGTTSISFDISSFAGVALGGNLRLLIDRDGDGFADNDVTPVSAGSLANNIITFSGISLQNGDRFTIGNTDLSTPLPVELISFTAQIEHGEVMLHWATASEKNNNYFTIQRSKNIEEWEDVVHVAGAGNSIEKREYTTSDGWPYEGVSYYRLKQTDFDGAFTYSSVRRVEIVSEEILRVYPNPTRSDFNLITGFDLNSNEISLINLMGQVVPFALEYESDRSVSIKPINPSTGVYLLRIRKGNYSRSVRVIIE